MIILNDFSSAKKPKNWESKKLKKVTFIQSLQRVNALSRHSLASAVPTLCSLFLAVPMRCFCYGSSMSLHVVITACLGSRAMWSSGEQLPLLLSVLFL